MENLKSLISTELIKLQNLMHYSPLRLRAIVNRWEQELIQAPCRMGVAGVALSPLRLTPIILSLRQGNEEPSFSTLRSSPPCRAWFGESGCVESSRSLRDPETNAHYIMSGFIFFENGLLCLVSYTRCNTKGRLKLKKNALGVSLALWVFKG
jgi:hypothetical protein